MSDNDGRRGRKRTLTQRISELEKQVSAEAVSRSISEIRTSQHINSLIRCQQTMVDGQKMIIDEFLKGMGDLADAFIKGVDVLAGRIVELRAEVETLKQQQRQTKKQRV